MKIQALAVRIKYGNVGLETIQRERLKLNEMKTKLFFHLLLIRLLYIILAMIAAVLIAALVAYIVANFTNNVHTIVLSCLISIWIVEIFIYALRSKIMYKKRIGIIDPNDVEKVNRTKKRLIKWYIATTTGFSIVFGVILYNLKENIIASINGPEEAVTSTRISNATILTVKIAIVTVLVAYWTLITIRRRKLKRSLKG